MKSITVDEFLREAVEAYEEEMASRDNSDYEVNEGQMSKLLDAYKFFLELAHRGGGRVEELQLEPKQEFAGITAYFVVFDVSGEDLKRFAEIVGNCSAFGMDTTSDDEVCISFNIPEVFQKRKSAQILRINPH